MRLICSILLILQFRYGITVNNDSNLIHEQLPASPFVPATSLDDHELIKLLTNSLKRNQDICACNQLAKMYLRMKQYDLARDTILHCLKINSSSVEAHINLGQTSKTTSQILLLLFLSQKELAHAVRK